MNDTREILRKIRRLELRTRRLVESSFAGQYQSVFKGRGMNFEEVRPYSPGDEIRAIDWNVTARTGEPFIKKFTEEREMTVMIILDVSASGNFGSVRESKRELAAEVAAILAFSAIHNNDKVGLLLFSDRVELFIPPKKGRHHILRLIREMLYFEPKGRGTDLAGALEYMNKLITRRAVVFVISDFFTGDFTRPLTVSARRHDMVALPIVDPAEEGLPDVGVILLEDPETGEQIEVNTSRSAITRNYAELSTLRTKELNSMFGSRGIDMVSLRTDKDYLPVLRNFFDRRGRRMAA
ncbi:MAG: DUF58 domain-containing protein [Chthoniobacterales bacterium]|jgi:uncharacterized protein (DUF58 family)|nr:DUF58 domain-containing protein [Chthoniobacterales bacterium]